MARDLGTIFPKERMGGCHGFRYTNFSSFVNGYTFFQMYSELEKHDTELNNNHLLDHGLLQSDFFSLCRIITLARQVK